MDKVSLNAKCLQHAVNGWSWTALFCTIALSCGWKWQFNVPDKTGKRAMCLPSDYFGEKQMLQGFHPKAECTVSTLRHLRKVTHSQHVWGQFEHIISHICTSGTKKLQTGVQMEQTHIPLLQVIICCIMCISLNVYVISGQRRCYLHAEVQTDCPRGPWIALWLCGP